MFLFAQPIPSTILAAVISRLRALIAASQPPRLILFEFFVCCEGLMCWALCETMLINKKKKSRSCRIWLSGTDTMAQGRQREPDFQQKGTPPVRPAQQHSSKAGVALTRESPASHPASTKGHPGQGPSPPQPPAANT